MRRSLGAPCAIGDGIRAMLVRLPFAFAQHLDPHAVHQQMQACLGLHSADGYLQLQMGT